MAQRRELTVYQGQARAQGAGKKPTTRKKSSAGTLAIFIVLMVPALALFMPTTLVFLIGMAPTLVAFIADRDPQKYAAVTVGPLNFCGVLPAEMELWREGHTMDMALQIIAEPFNWLLMYGLAGLGWLIFFSIPPVVAVVVAHRHQMEVQRLKDRQTTLVEEWGDGVAASPSQNQT